ncbi:MAG: sulfatase [Verrucomicrobia bacterium]|nr:sulfatase [Verrucomicrobiota bacterium]
MPNVLIIQTDQQSLWTLGAYGGAVVQTPHIDSLARDGATCTNFFVNSAVCTPSRGCLLTGRYPHCHGAFRNPMPINNDEVTFARILAGHGYDTAYIGKWHLDGEERPPDELIPRERAMGFADSRYMINRGHYKSVEEEAGGNIRFKNSPGEGRYMTDWLVDKTVEYLSTPRERPFLGMLCIPDPHSPYTVREPYASMFEPRAMSIPPTFYEDRHPSWVRDAPIAAEYVRSDPDSEAMLRRCKAAYCGMVKCIDDNVGRILSCLEERGLTENTAVIFTTDHGEYMGEHGLIGKNMLYETAYRVPMIVRWPEGIAPRTRIDRFITTVDFQQTLLGLLGLAGCGREQGRDASPFFRGKAVEWTDEAFIHHSRFGYSGIFTPVFELGLARCGEHILFDRRHDPDQVDNLAERPEFRDVVASLAERVVRHNRDLDSPAMEWLGDRRGKGRTQPHDDDVSIAPLEWYRTLRR